LVGVLLDGAKIPADAKILDVGCGTGGMEILLHRYGKVTGVDASEIALSFARRRGLAELRRAELPNLPFADRSFDLVGIFDVLYHRNVGDDSIAAKELWRVTKPGGRIVVTDSALGFLKGPHDVAMHGARRYSSRGIRELLEGAGFVVERSGYANFLLFPLAAPWRLIQRWLSRGPAAGHSDVSPAPGWVNGLLGMVYGAEAALLRLFDLPIGTSILAIARKPA
jgi:SAM-dependent methyltransferase